MKVYFGASGRWVAFKCLDRSSQGALVLSEYGHAGWDRAVSPEQWLFGEALPDLYEELFGKNFTINTGALQKPHGPPMALVDLLKSDGMLPGRWFRVET